MPIFDDRLWAGTNESLAAVVAADELHAARLKAGWSEDAPDDEDEDKPTEHDLLQVVGNIGVIQVNGAMVNSDAWYLKHYGMVGYPQIKSALVAAANNPDVKHVLLNINSGGGSVNGCQDTVALIKKINDNLKPVDAYTGGTMASAAYWLGSSAGKISATDTAIVGSIGVLATHKEYSKMYADMGIGVKVVRSGPYKALVNPNEPLSKEGEAQLQSMVDATNTVFVNHVAAARNRTPEYVDGTMGQGREFVGAQAADVGLVDSITSLDALISNLQRRYIDTGLRGNDTQGKQGFGFRADTKTEIEMTKGTLTDDEIAALKAKQANAGAKEPAANAGTDKTDAENPDTTGTKVDASSGAGTAGNEHANFAEALALVNADLVNARVENTQIKAELEKLKAIVPQLADIASKSLSQMRVALGGTEVQAGTMSPEDLLAAHTTAAVEFTKKFPVGGVASVNPQATTGSTTNKQLDAFRMAAANAAKRKR